jgi:hypothetical protein
VFSLPTAGRKLAGECTPSIRLEKNVGSSALCVGFRGSLILAAEFCAHREGV